MDIDFCFLSPLAGPHHVGAHSHPSLELVYCIEGSGEIEFSGVKYSYTRNYFHITSAGTYHEQWNEEDLTSICIGMKNSGLEPYEGCYYDREGTIRKLCEQVVEEYVGGKTAHRQICSGLGLQIAGMVKRLVSEQNENGESEHIVHKAIKIIREKEGDISVDNLSKLLYISSDYLRHLVKEKTDQSPIKHIIDARINKAKNLLISSEASITEIAEECGFESLYYFSQFFKKAAGLSPSKYRKKMKDEAILPKKIGRGGKSTYRD